VFTIENPREAARRACWILAWFFAALAPLWSAHLSDKYHVL
jgi:hypothetical protein